MGSDAIQRAQRRQARPVWQTALLALGAVVLFLNYWPLKKLPIVSSWLNDTVEIGLCNGTLDNWINEEAALSWTKIFEQIGPPAGATVREGFVIASPSTKDPDYFYTWTRDSAIVTSAVLQKLLRTGDTSLESHLRLFAYSQKALQHVCNPSGCFTGGMHGLGEPKFNVDGTAFIGSWGRPQRDGPALRAITLLGFADYLLSRGTQADHDFVKDHLYKPELPAESVIKADLEYVSQYWHLNGFDLWEEIDGHHFFTHIASRTALEQGAALASRLGDTGAASFYALQAGRITQELRKYLHRSSGIIDAYQEPKQFNRTGLDAAVPLGVLISGSKGTEEWGPANEYVLATIKAYVDSFRSEYKINDGKPVVPVATGRYAEDVYDGIGISLGNPWYLTTLSVAHVLSRALHYYTTTPAPIHVTEVSKPFWAQFDPTVAAGDVHKPSSAKWSALLKAMSLWADGFWGIVKKYEGVNGQLDEQINRDSGLPQGAKNLTWSYAAFYLASLDRADACGISSH